MRRKHRTKKKKKGCSASICNLFIITLKLNTLKYDLKVAQTTHQIMNPTTEPNAEMAVTSALLSYNLAGVVKLFLDSVTGFNYCFLLWDNCQYVTLSRLVGF